MSAGHFFEIYPFGDGNGRTFRIMLISEMKRMGFALTFTQGGVQGVLMYRFLVAPILISAEFDAGLHPDTMQRRRSKGV